jgi:hypothetical protein
MRAPLPHFCKKARQAFSTLLFPDPQLSCDVAGVNHGIVQRPMPEKLKAELICCAQRCVVRAQRGQAVSIICGRRRVETGNLIVIYGMVFLVLGT